MKKLKLSEVQSSHLEALLEQAVEVQASLLEVAQYSSRMRYDPESVEAVMKLEHSKLVTYQALLRQFRHYGGK